MADYVIVGAGSAGCVVAARLTEDPAVSVTLLEAGGRDTARNITVPAAFGQLFRTEVDWDYATEPEPGCDNREMYWPRGKVLGGSSSINAMIYIRGNRADFDGWRDGGCPGWGYEDVLPFFLRSEGNERGGSTYHSARGPLTVSDQRSPHVITRAFVEAAAQAGLALNADFNGATQDGIGIYQATQHNGRRCSAARAFLAPAMNRPNLSVVTGALAARVIVERGHAAGVEAIVDGRRQVFRAEREIVLAAGAVGTPQLLLLSGIGPADDLRAHEIDVVADSPNVGRNLQDHVAAGASYHTPQPVTMVGADRNPKHIANYLFRHRGPFSSVVAEGGGFVKTDPTLAAPDLQLLFAPALFLDHGFTDPPGHGIVLAPYLLTPESRGSITLRSADPTAKPRIQANYYAEPADLARMVVGLRLCFDIAAQPALAPYVSGRFLPIEGADSDDELTAFLRAKSETIYHPTSTAAMGPSETDVCDPHLQVRGVTGLRVADASIMPTVTRGNTNAPTIMIGEKAADLIRTA
ncbi:MAG TPA: GMC family oxidoreductase N-terminal domain-containing protein [Mycobacteriales bacterium]|nr:GMC family oxidoreductase N-terminal domain-containing protein [Mycobacteriales bacterium]